jgi:hypothetical protein
MEVLLLKRVAKNRSAMRQHIPELHSINIQTCVSCPPHTRREQKNTTFFILKNVRKPKCNLME